jgi:AraC-like DNA-binding protein
MRSRIISWGVRALYIGPTFELGPHRNGVAVLCVGLDGDIHSAAGARPKDGAWVRSRTALAPAGTMHIMRFDASTIGCLYLDPQDGDLSILTGSMQSHGALFVNNAREAAIIELFRHAADGPLDSPELRDSATAMFGFSQRKHCDHRVSKVVDLIRRDPASAHRLGKLAEAVGLSESRLRHAFKDAIGVPVSRFRTWSRMGAALRLAAAGASLTEAAHDAGFSSSAHFSTAFRAMFGLPPSVFMNQGPEIMTVRSNKAATS